MTMMRKLTVAMGLLAGTVLTSGEANAANGATPWILLTATNYVVGPPEKSEPTYSYKTLAGQWRVTQAFGKFVALPGGGSMWSPDPRITITPFGVNPNSLITVTTPAGQGIDLGGGVTAGRITHMRVRLEKVEGDIWVVQDYSDRAIP